MLGQGHKIILTMSRWPNCPNMCGAKYVTHLHKTSLKSRFLHVELKIPFCRVQSVLQFGENQKSILFFYLKLLNFENSKNIQS